ncbi:hypothetical protein AB0O22_26220 [Streptomyces sp. NPDC091204]|uniref:hypothetical protein n=1 Tax=Streptomyces sp. NPDC091204 TaxID=3155299 RepID=UPI0034185F3C
MDPQKALADDIDDIDEQERHVHGAEPVPQVTRHHVERVHGSGGLRSRQHRCEPDPIIRHISLERG